MYTRNLFGKFLTDIHCSKEKRKHEHQKKEGEKRAAHNVALLKNKRATPTSLLLIKRSGTPPSLTIEGVALASGARKSAALVHIVTI